MSLHAAKLEHIRALLHDKPEQARAMCQRLVQSSPRDAWAQATMARVLLRLGNTQQALHYAQCAAELGPTYPELQVEHAEALVYESQLIKAIDVLRKAQVTWPDHQGCSYRLALTLEQLSRHAEAEEVCRAGLKGHPENEGLQSLLAGALLNLGRIEEAIKLTRAAAARHPEVTLLSSGLALMLNYAPGVSPTDVLEAHRAYGKLLDHDPPSARRFTNSRDPSRRLRIGLVSPDLRQHSVAYFIEPWLEHVSRDTTELFVYQTNRFADAVTARLKTLVVDRNAGRWQVMDNISDVMLAEKILADGVDILIELSGHTHGHSLMALHRRAAPVQVSYLGYPNTTGLKEVGYRIVDSITDPAGPADQLAVEKLMRLDPCFLCYKPPSDPPKPAPSAPRAHITFGSFNTVQKLNASVIACWSRLLAATPDAHLLLKGGMPEDQGLRDGVLARFHQAGVAHGRIEFLPSTKATAEHLALYARVDIALDPFPYNGTTTTCEALYMGVPVVTLAGNMHAGRVGTSLLTNIGLPNLIADTEDGYIDLARRLAGDSPRREHLRSSLRAMVQASPLCNAQAFAARMESAVRIMWNQWCSSAPMP